jgi:hypothetical protein
MYVSEREREREWRSEAGANRVMENEGRKINSERERVCVCVSEI